MKLRRFIFTPVCASPRVTTAAGILARRARAGRALWLMAKLLAMSPMGLGRAKTKSDLVVMPSGRQIFAFFALRMTVELPKFRVRLYRVEFLHSQGHSRPMHSVPVPINVRCYSNSDIIVRRSEMTLWASFGLMHRSKFEEVMRRVQPAYRFSLRSVPKSIGLVSSASAPLSKAWRFVSASP